MCSFSHALIEGQQSQRLVRLSGQPPGTCKLDGIESAQRMRFSQLARLSNDFFRYFDFENLDIVDVQGGNALAVLGEGGALLPQHASQRGRQKFCCLATFFLLT